MLHWTGAKTVITRGWGNKPFPVGGAADFPVDGGAEFLQASSDSGLKDELRHKEEQMAAMGSQIISGKGRYVASAETSRISSEGEYATLADISKSLSDSASLIMSDFNAWAGSSDMAVIEFNSDFDSQDIPQGRLVELMGAVQSGFMSMEIFFYNLKGYETYPQNWTLEDELKAIDESMKKQIENREPANGEIIDQSTGDDTTGKISGITFNGAQIQAIQKIVEAVGSGTITVESGRNQLVILLGLSQEQASKIIADVGTVQGAKAQGDIKSAAGVI